MPWWGVLLIALGSAALASGITFFGVLAWLGKAFTW
jgi:hypothetical protein